MEGDSTNSERAFTTMELQAAGASDELISLYLSAVPSGVKRELNEKYGGEILDQGGDPTDVAGGWFTKMWNGELFWALCHADSTNTAALAEVWDREDFIENGVDVAGEPYDYVVRMIDDNLPGGE